MLMVRKRLNNKIGMEQLSWANIGMIYIRIKKAVKIEIVKYNDLIIIGLDWIG